MDSIKWYAEHFNCCGFGLPKYPLASGEASRYVTPSSLLKVSQYPCRLKAVCDFEFEDCYYLIPILL